jgi:SAM-dependent methyltransferase
MNPTSRETPGERVVSGTPDEGAAWDLENLANATRLCNWMFDQFAAAIEGSVVEVGAGIGTFSERVLRCRVDKLLLIEPEAACMRVLERRFGNDDRVELAQEHLPDSPALAVRPGSFDFALCQNVLEHIADDAAALRTIAAALRPGGRLGLLVPANPNLFGRLDSAYGHLRRYTPEGLRSRLEATGMQIEELYPFNLLGVPGWWTKNRIGSAGVDLWSLRVYELLLRIWRPLEDRRHPRSGLSLVALAQKL